MKRKNIYTIVIIAGLLTVMLTGCGMKQSKKEAMQAMSVGDFDLAETKLLERLADDEDDYDSVICFAYTLLMEGDAEGAVDVLETWLSSNGSFEGAKEKLAKEEYGALCYCLAEAYGDLGKEKKSFQNHLRYCEVSDDKEQLKTEWYKMTAMTESCTEYCLENGCEAIYEATGNDIGVYIRLYEMLEENEIEEAIKVYNDLMSYMALVEPRLSASQYLRLGDLTVGLAKKVRANGNLGVDREGDALTTEALLEQADAYASKALELSENDRNGFSAEKLSIVVAELQGKYEKAYRLLEVMQGHYPDNTVADKEMLFLKNRLKDLI